MDVLIDEAPEGTMDWFTDRLADGVADGASETFSDRPTDRKNEGVTASNDSKG